ncbi:MAG TPA: hypothetical protein VH397_18430 [Xanthobacteraceae bacterium]|jgi:hypothetical protein
MFAFASSEATADGWQGNLEGDDRTAAALLSEPRLLDNGSIDYDFYRARARRLRQEFVAEVRFSFAQQAIRSLTLLVGGARDWRREHVSTMREQGE